MYVPVRTAVRMLHAHGSCALGMRIPRAHGLCASLMRMRLFGGMIYAQPIRLAPSHPAILYAENTTLLLILVST